MKHPDATVDRPPAAAPAAGPAGPPSSPGPLGRLGLWSARHVRTVLAGWLLAVLALGAFAPQVTTALSGAGWQADGSESVKARQVAEQHFGGNASTALQIVVTADRPVDDPAVRQVLAQASALASADPGCPLSSRPSRAPPSARTAGRPSCSPGRRPPPTTWSAPPTISRVR
ncbi:hypothetical protein [Kitasatospora purpeofusca]|uniref:hypothetical protein n=1 Tax=Kitasatospora purpeofusca TaxID=67352 RepID=UPI003F4AE45F